MYAINMMLKLYIIFLEHLNDLKCKNSKLQIYRSHLELQLLYIKYLHSTPYNNCPKLLVCVRRAAAAAARATGWDGPGPCTQLRSTIWLAASPAVMHDPRVATYVAPFGCRLAGTEALSSIWPLLPLSCEPLKRSYI